MNVVVVGAGLAGLAAAWRLAECGHEVSVLERRERVGGGIDAELVDGFELESTLHGVHSGDRRLLAWIRELGLADELLPLRPLQITQLYGTAATPIDPQSLWGVASIPGVSPRDALRLVRWGRLLARYAPLLDPTAPERAAPLDDRSVADFARLYFGRSVLARWIAPEVIDRHGAEATDLSRVTALLAWTARATGRRRPASDGLPRRSLAAIARAAAERLPVHCGVEVTRIDELPAGGFSVECRGSGGEGDASESGQARRGRHARGEIDADAIVLATSAHEAQRIAHVVVSPAERDFLAGVQQGPDVTLALALERAPCGMPQRIRVPHEEDRAVDAVLLEPGIAGGRAPMGAGVLVARASERFARANAAVSDDVVEKGLVSALATIRPGLMDTVRATRLSRRHSAIPRFVVGAYRALARFRRVESDLRGQSRRLYFAGDYLVGPGPEAAVASGERAARDLQADTEGPRANGLAVDA